jgi:STAS-like domain of unknown function (DUF4325)
MICTTENGVYQGRLNYSAEPAAEGGAIRVVERCVNTGSREGAIPLRRKIQALLRDMGGPVMLDFSGIEMTSSSFLDELLGRLAAALGPKEFHDGILVGVTIVMPSSVTA